MRSVLEYKVDVLATLLKDLSTAEGSKRFTVVVLPGNLKHLGTVLVNSMDEGDFYNPMQLKGKYKGIEFKVCTDFWQCMGYQQSHAFILDDISEEFTDVLRMVTRLGDTPAVIKIC